MGEADRGNSRLLRNAQVITQRTGGYHSFATGAVAVMDGKIIWVGDDRMIPSKFHELPEEDLGGRLLTPGLIDCHTHLVFAGSRANEYARMLHGESYAEITASGGGIMATVEATRNATEDELLRLALRRVDDMLDCGVTTIEIKSGYGLLLEYELKQLRVIEELRKRRPVRVKATLLAAHKLPPEYEGRSDDYIDYVCDEVIPAVAEAGLADAVDAYCEQFAFSREQVERVFKAARQCNLAIKLHTEQFSNQHGAALAAGWHALSADHLEYLQDEDIGVLARSGIVAVVLPGAFYTVREIRLPPVQQLIYAGVPVAIATDSNPGTSPMTSLLLAMNMACTMFRMTPDQALAGVTRHAAKALGLELETGVIEPGKAADLACWDLDHADELSYLIGVNRLYRRYYAGQYAPSQNSTDPRWTVSVQLPPG